MIEGGGGGQAGGKLSGKKKSCWKERDGDLRRRKTAKGEGSPNDERQISFCFLPPLLMKRPILSVG